MTARGTRRLLSWMMPGPGAKTAHSGVTALDTNITPVAAGYELTTFSTSNTSSSSFKTRDCQEVLKKEKAWDMMREDLTKCSCLDQEFANVFVSFRVYLASH
eukprot:TRINITY_DN14157_c0_g1_i1.p2 TRINITY_DN14157_c0_g1~~TRINITY_DN14157_c0_g1_i1.p2  ORF type:complete len:102 (-),score=34.29 TRINITY_DN14157_c0_g1_i1:60-365(-)